MKILVSSTLLISIFSICTAQVITELCPDDLTNGTIVNFENYEDVLYATGFFNEICGSEAFYLARLDNDQWVSTGFDLSNPGHKLANIGDDLYMTSYVESIDSNWLYAFDGNSIEKFGSGVYLTTANGLSNLPNIYDVIEFEGKLIICGEFDRIGQKQISGIAQWNGIEWEELGGGLAGNIFNTAPVMYPHQMVVYGGNLYVVGNFRYAGSEQVNGVAKWTGNNWQALGDGFNSTVYGIEVFNDEIYVGGDFTKSGEEPIHRIAKWNSNGWVSPGFGFLPATMNDYSFVHTLKEVDEELYIAGGLQKILMADQTEITCGGIIKFSDETINTFSGGVEGNDIEAIIQNDAGEILIGGGVWGNGYFGIITESSSTDQAIPVSDLIQLSPNPVYQVLNLESTGSADIMKLKIIDPSGRIIMTLQQLNFPMSIDISPLAKGIYTVQVFTNENMHHQIRFIKI